MRIASVGTLSSHLRPLCSRDNHVMKYEAAGSMANSGDEASYHCGSVGCSARYNATNGYFMLIGMAGHAIAMDEPGVNTFTCPRHGRWLYRQEDIEAESGVRWLCGVEGCDYGYSANRKADRVRT